MLKVYENHTKQVLETLCGLPVFGVRCWGWAPVPFCVLPNNFWFLGLHLQKRWYHCNQSWLCRLQELHKGVVPGSFLLQPGSLCHQEWVFRVHSGLALQIQIEWPCLEVIFFSQASVGMLLRLLSYPSLRSWVLLQSVMGRQPGIFLINIFSISLKPHILGWFLPPCLHAHCVLPSTPAPFSPPHGGHLMVSGEIPPRAEAQEFMQSWTTLWVFPGLDSIDKRLCSQPPWTAHVFI